MLNLQRLALELLEYKVNDLRLRRKPLGGTSSAWALYEHLLEELPTLSPEDRRRFEELCADLKRFGEVATHRRQEVANFDQLVLEAEPVVAQAAEMQAAGAMPAAPQTAAEEQEQRVLQRLARKAWWSDVGRVIGRLAASSRAERDRATVRLIYALVRNLGQYARSSSFAEDLELKHFSVTEPVSELADPLASFNDVDSIRELYLGLAETILSFTQPESPYTIAMPAERSFSYLRKMALQIAQDPYAGEVGSLRSKSASSKQIRLAIEELAKDPMRAEERQAQRRQLEARLKEALAHEKSQRQLFERDVLRYQEVVDAFFNQLRPHLPKRVGGEADEPRLAGGVLFAENPALRIEQIPPDASTVTVQFKGPLRFSLGGVPLALVRSGESLVLYANDEEHFVAPSMNLDLGRRRLRVFREGAYLHFRLSEETRPLAALAAEALAVGHVYRSPHKEALLNVLKAASGAAASDPQEVVREAIGRFRQLTSHAPDAESALKGFLHGARRAASSAVPEDAVDGLAMSLFRAISGSPADIVSVLEGIDAPKKTMYELGDDPISLTLAGMPLTIRQYRGRGGAADNVVVMMPGRPLGSFTDYLLEPFAGGLLLCVRAEEDLLVVFYTQAAETQIEA